MADVEYQAPDGSVMKVTVGLFGQHDVTVELRSLKEKFTIAELLAMVYPIFDAKEKAGA
jgi:hypothetical protein